jgi:hypothetical protein
VRKRNSSGQVLKSAAREGDSDGPAGVSGRRDRAAGVTGDSPGCGGGETGWAAMGESAVMSQRLGQGYDEKCGVGPVRACP